MHQITIAQEEPWQEGCFHQVEDMFNQIKDSYMHGSHFNKKTFKNSDPVKFPSQPDSI